MEPNQMQPKKNGPAIISLVIVLIVIIGALYLFASRSDEPTIPENTQTTQVQPVTSSSDEITSIEADLNTAISGLEGQDF